MTSLNAISSADSDAIAHSLALLRLVEYKLEVTHTHTDFCHGTIFRTLLADWRHEKFNSYLKSNHKIQYLCTCAPWLHPCRYYCCQPLNGRDSDSCCIQLQCNREGEKDRGDYVDNPCIFNLAIKVLTCTSLKSQSEQAVCNYQVITLL